MVNDVKRLYVWKLCEKCHAFLIPSVSILANNVLWMQHAHHG